MPENLLIEIVSDLKYILQSDQGIPVLKYLNEPNPEDLEIIYNPPVVEQTNIETKFKTRDKSSDPLNFTCEKCEAKMYPVKVFKKTGKNKILILKYSGSISGRARPDRSGKYLFQTEEEDDLFLRMCKASGFQIEDFHYQELPGCFFNPSASTEEDWKKRVENCMEHVADTIASESIQTCIFLGNAAPLYFGKNRAAELARNMTACSIKIGNNDVTAYVLRSPAAILAMEQKRKTAPAELKNSLLEEEKLIKNSILKVLKSLS